MGKAYLVGINYNRKENKKILKHLRRGRGIKIARVGSEKRTQGSHAQKNMKSNGVLKPPRIPP